MNFLSLPDRFWRGRRSPPATCWKASYPPAALLLAFFALADFAHASAIVYTYDAAGNRIVAASLSSTLGPAITQQPMTQISGTGYQISFSVFATGSEPLAYQWFFNNASIPGATSSTYFIPSVSGSDFGNYTVQVSNGNGTVTSGTAQLLLDSAGNGLPDARELEYFGSRDPFGNPYLKTVAQGGKLAPISQSPGALAELRVAPNLYEMEKNNPIDNFDPLGLCKYKYAPLGRIPSPGPSRNCVAVYLECLAAKVYAYAVAFYSGGTPPAAGVDCSVQEQNCEDINMVNTVLEWP
jgi:hypothetical protein